MRTKRTQKLLSLLVMICLIPSSLAAMSAEEIIRKTDEMQTFDTAITEGELQITDRFGTKISTFIAWSRGSEESLIEFTSTAERGQKILRTEDSIYLYYPDAQELIRMQGAALRQGMLGSDVSYEDMTGDNDRLSQYEVVLDGEQVIGDRMCYKLSLTATTRSVPYPKETIWIDKEHFIVLKGEYSTKSGRLIKEIDVLETGRFDDLVLATTTRISDTMKADSQTLMIIRELQVNVPIDSRIFSLDELSW
ncbi:MAG: outer membrane lipoprotein-sorting protein [Spirochaetia bacterium]|nr:outer membrane lipoprotein-sorting protein [Spirochaetia bacterium]